MDTHLTEAREFDSSPSDSVNLKQTLDGSSPKSPPPVTKTLDDQLSSSAVPSELNPFDSSNFDDLSPFCKETLDDLSDSALFLDVESREDEDEGQTLHSSPTNTVPAYSSSVWSLREKTETTKPLVSVSSAFGGENKPAMVGAGIANLGNTCFLNAVLQCLTHTVPLVRGLWLYNHPNSCDRDSEGFCVLCALRNHVELSLTSMGGIVSPWKLVGNLSYFSSNFRRFQQEDAHEFLQCLLDRLENCFTYSKTKDTTLPSEDENLVKQIFGGRLISKLRCCNCGHCSDTYEPLVDLSLEIENVDTLPSALESFTQVEKIEDIETQYTCENCKERVSIEKQLILDQAPSIAQFHLKRFKNDGSFVEKIDKHVEFPLDLDLLPYVNGSPNSNVELKYDLYAVVVHTGLSSTSGHYYSFVRSARDAWYRLDDSKVARVQEDYVLSQEAYILFYAKQGAPWFSDFIETEMSSLYQNVSNNSPKSVLDIMDHVGTSSLNMANNHSVEIKKVIEEVVEGNEAKDETHKTPIGICSSSDGTLGEVDKKFSPSPLIEKNLNQEFGEVNNKVKITPPMPPRSPSPDIYAEEPPVVSCAIPRDHLKSEKQVPCKRQLEKDLDDSERRQARKLLKHMPNDRSAKLLAAMNGSRSEASLNGKKSRGRQSYPNRNNRSSSTSHKPNLNSVLRPVAAGSLR
ncbi:Ubiquitin carboxyl-terminal hydrolase [Actinidia chinensis var. chinensis]|uniref:Ubiquitin carboxyl-terminal hydrolase n=1 Tax=Actinidia chinensis var. chinensis TaxID=1590841 RepID=A0A2R6PCW9_ACTCC|nr:Ubiquitin carboxyl-terminal hydrolase [Actinidia chinensis var. chinensis]